VKTYELLCKADTHGVFQLEATFAKRILIDMQPNSSTISLSLLH